MAKIKNTNDSLCWKGRGVRGTLIHSLLVEMQTCTTTMAVSQKIGNNLLQDSAISFLGICPKYAQSYYKSICSSMFIAVLFVTARTWKQSRCLSTEERIKKMWHIYTLEYYSAVKKNNILHFACKWMELENTTLSEVTQTQKMSVVCTHS